MSGGTEWRCHHFYRRDPLLTWSPESCFQVAHIVVACAQSVVMCVLI